MNSRLLKEKMLELEMTPEALAVKIGRSCSTIFNMLAGKSVSDKTLHRAARVLGLKPAQLLEIDEKAAS